MFIRIFKSLIYFIFIFLVRSFKVLTLFRVLISELLFLETKNETLKYYACKKFL